MHNKLQEVNLCETNKNSFSPSFNICVRICIAIPNYYRNTSMIYTATLQKVVLLRYYDKIAFITKELFI